MGIGKFAVVEILDARELIRFTLPGSGRIRKINCLYKKEIYTDIAFEDIKHAIDYAYGIPRRLLAAEWNGSHTTNVFK